MCPVRMSIGASAGEHACWDLYHLSLSLRLVMLGWEEDSSVGKQPAWTSAKNTR